MLKSSFRNHGSQFALKDGTQRTVLDTKQHFQAINDGIIPRAKYDLLSIVNL